MYWGEEGGRGEEGVFGGCDHWSGISVSGGDSGGGDHGGGDSGE